MQILTFPSLSLKTLASPKAPPHWPRSKWGTICTTVHLICVLKCRLKKVHEKHSAADNEGKAWREKGDAACDTRDCRFMQWRWCWDCELLSFSAGCFCLPMPRHAAYSTANEIPECGSMCLVLGVHMEAFSKPPARAHVLKFSLLFLVVCQAAPCFFAKPQSGSCCPNDVL